jgi:hypothetical protein
VQLSSLAVELPQGRRAVPLEVNGPVRKPDEELIIEWDATNGVFSIAIAEEVQLTCTVRVCEDGLAYDEEFLCLESLLLALFHCADMPAEWNFSQKLPPFGNRSFPLVCNLFGNGWEAYIHPSTPISCGVILDIGHGEKFYRFILDKEMTLKSVRTFLEIVSKYE